MKKFQLFHYLKTRLRNEMRSCSGCASFGTKLEIKIVARVFHKKTRRKPDSKSQGLRYIFDAKFKRSFSVC